MSDGQTNKESITPCRKRTSFLRRVISSIFRPIKQVWRFYYEGFQSMTLGKTLWAVILIKLCIMFVILRVFFFKPALSKCNNDTEKSEQVINNLIKSNNSN